MENNSIKVGDNLIIAGVQYAIKHIETCKDCSLCNTRTCAMLDPAISCGEKTHLGFETVGFGKNIDTIYQFVKNNRKQYKNKNNKQSCMV